MSTSGDHSVIVDDTTNGTDLMGVIVKKERIDEDIKEYAETAMNELLGWYGYSNSNKDQRKDSVIRQVREMRKSPANSSGSESHKSGHTRTTDICGWCGKSVDEHSGLTSNNTIFCSELCFSQSRRANFKKSKTCDWCKHVRHTVAYVDFQEGASQLQFCSDKCLNQYKMHIFCRETRAHLEMHPHLAAEDTTTNTSALITPDLWMKNCKSPSSRNSSPVRVEERPPSPLPLITVTHPSKLMATPTPHSHPRKKKLRKRNSLSAAKNDVAQDLRVPKSASSMSKPYFLKNSSSTPSTITNGHRDFPELTSRLFGNANNAEMQFGRANGNRLPPVPSNPRPLPTENQPGIDGMPEMTNYGMLRPNLLPPVAVMVPYPLLLPVPIPIPIPLPFSAFLQAAKLSKGTSTGSHHNGEENGDLKSDTDETNMENGTGGFRSEDDEQIVVDDVNGDTRAPLKLLLNRSKMMKTTDQLRKRKRAIPESAVKANGESKLKKSVSV